MIRKIIKIKNLGIFIDFKWNSSIPDFKRFNLIYGWNGSGKTTLSQLLASSTNGIPETYPDLEYKIQTDDGDFTELSQYTRQIRTFNRDYITENIDMFSGKAKPIFILGKENKQLAATIKEDEKLLKGDPENKNDLGKLNELQLKKSELDKKIREKGKQFTDVAKIISSNTSGVSARNYRKNNAEQAFKNLKAKQILSDEERDKYSLTLKQQEKTVLNKLSSSDIKEIANSTISNAQALLRCTVENIVIKRLKENADISKWVEQGLELHILRNSSNCEFCDRPLPKNRLSGLLAHFNDADKKLKDDIITVISNIDQVNTKISEINALDKANLYDEFQNEYSLKVNNLNTCKEELLKNILEFKKEVDVKKSHTTEQLELKSSLDVEPFISAINSVNIIINKHNEKTKNFSQAKTKATSMLEKHYLSEIFDDVNKLESDIIKIRNDIVLIEKGNPQNPKDIGIERIQKRITENKNKISTSGKACREINKQLKTFLGRDDLTFEIADGGYIIKRKGRIAKNLSEGEKTAIAFVYFTIHLRDQDFKIDDSIVIIDDPICSLDSNSLFQAFAFLKNSVKNSHQVFILTHNFDFLRLLLNWLNYPSNRINSQHYMIKNLLIGDNRIATLDKLDDLLRDYESEYQYLFKILYEFKSDGTIASVYHIPNITRKVLEYLLMIMIPNNQSMYKKMESLEFDDNKITAIYKFANDQSHITGSGFNPSLVQESQNNVKYLLEMMEAVFPKHYKILENSVSSNG